MIGKISKNFWEERYIANNTPWDIGEPAPAFVKYFQNTTPNSNLKVAVLGCGRGHDAFYLANLKEGNVNESRFQIYGFDFSESAISFCNEIKEKNSLKNINFYKINFFDLAKDINWKNYFDYVIEHTSFCAIDPSYREEYVNLIKHLLKSGGKLVGLFFIRPIELGGPPFGSTEEEVRELLNKDFLEIENLHQEDCPHAFTGKEYLGVFEKK